MYRPEFSGVRADFYPVCRLRPARRDTGIPAGGIGPNGVQIFQMCRRPAESFRLKFV